MAEPVLRIHTGNETQPTPAPVARIAADPLMMLTVAELVPCWPDGETPDARQRGVQRYCEGLAKNTATAGLVRKVAGRWEVSPLAPDPTLPPDSGRTLRDFVAERTGRVVHHVLGVYVPPALAAQIPEWTDSGRAWFFGMCELARQLSQHDARLPGVERPERDRLFRADPDRQKYATAKGITRWSARSIREFVRKVERGIDPDRRGRPSLGELEEDRNCSPEAWARFRMLFLDPRRRSVKLCWEIIAAEAEEHGWAWPALRSIQRRCRAELPASIADYHRLGARRYEAKHATFIERDRQAQYRPGECWVCDHTRENFWTWYKRHWVRKWVTIWVDAYSGLILSAVRSLHPNSDTILLGFRLAVQKYGAPLHVVFDNGRDFRAHAVAGGRKRFDRERVEGVMGSLGIGITWAEPFHGQSKGVCERLFGPMDQCFWRLLPSWCGANPGERPQDLTKQLRDGSLEAIDDEEVERQFHSWIAAWNARPREHLADKYGPRSPDQVFQQDNPIARRTAAPEVLDELCLPIVRCTVGRLGVKVRGIWYGQDSARLPRLHGEEVRVRFDPDDASRVSVLDEQGRLIAHAYNRRLTGVTHDDIRVGKRRKARAVALAKLARPTTPDRLSSVTLLAQQVAAQRRAAERAEALRVAVGAEAEPPPRNVELLPGAAEAADALRKLHEAPVRPTRSMADLENRDRSVGDGDTGGSVWNLLTSRFGDAEPVEEPAWKLQDRLLRELGDIAPEPDEAEVAHEQREREARELCDGAPDAEQGGKSA